MRRRAGGHGAAANYRAQGSVQRVRRSDWLCGPLTGWALDLALSGLELLEKPGLGLWWIGFVVVGSRAWWRRLPPLPELCPRSQYIALSMTRFPEQSGVLGLANLDPVVLPGRHKFHDFNVKSVF